MCGRRGVGPVGSGGGVAGSGFRGGRVGVADGVRAAESLLALEKLLEGLAALLEMSGNKSTVFKC